jgi:hypothetical protein
MADVELKDDSEAELADARRRKHLYRESDEFWDFRQVPDDAVLVSWKDHFEFLVSGDGGLVLWRRAPGVPDEVLFTYLLNQVLSYCLLARGIEPLHATAFVVDGCAIALMGSSGCGKSTLAAAFVRRGFPLLTDDVLVPVFAQGSVLGYPSLARLKLEPEAATAIFGARPALPMNAFTSKLILPLQSAEHAAGPVPLRSIYLIAPESSTIDIAIHGEAGQGALLPLIANTFEPTLFNRRRMEQQFHFANRLAAMVPLMQLSYPRTLERLHDVTEAVLADLRERGAAA